MKKYLQWLVSTLVLTIIIFPQSPPVDTLTVRKALSLAYEMNPGLRKLKAEMAATRGMLTGNSGLSDPVITYSREGMGNGSFSGFDEQRVGVSQDIRFPGTTAAMSDNYKNRFEALQLEYKALQLEIREQVKKKYVELQAGLEKLHLARQDFDISTRVYEVVQEKYRSGEATKIELLKTKIQVDEASNSISEAQLALHEARYSLFNLIGLETTQQKYSINYPDTLSYQKVIISQEDILSTFTEMPAVLAKMKHINAAQDELGIAKSSYYPNFTLDLFGQDFGSGFKSVGFEIGLSVPLWFSSNQAGLIEQAEAGLNSKKEDYREELLLMKKEVEVAWHGYESARENLDRYNEGILANSQELLDLTTEGYRLGELDFLNLLEAQRTFLTSSRNYYNYLLEYHFRLIELEKFSSKEFIYQE
ncbi:MAG: transporter [Ignavibacteriaceae bacterium]|nr:MAG: transporter [Ignavibacteriaceae bacterium]